MQRVGLAVTGHPLALASSVDRDAHAARRVVLVAGGTAGHVYPALAIAKAYRQHLPSTEVLFVGTPEGYEAKLVPRYGHTLLMVRSTPVVGETWARKVRTVGSMGGAVMRARRLLTAANPDLVIGFGGYASVPTILAARSLGVPTAIHEGNVVAGLANRMLSRFVDRIYLGFAEAIKEFQTGSVLVTGNPVRPDVAALANQPHDAPVPGQPYRILVTGGSEGSFFLNRQVPKLLARLASGGLTFEVVHQSGLADQDSVREAYREASLKSSVTPFVEDIAKAYQWADFAITCSGAATLAEVAIVGLPLLPVPLSTAAKNHQVFNTIAFARVTGAFWLSENAWKSDQPDKKIATLLSHQMAWREASESVRRFARPEANRALVTDTEAIIKARRLERKWSR